MTAGECFGFNFQTATAVIARSESDEAIQFQCSEKKAGLLRGACHRARIRATRWLAMTEDTVTPTPADLPDVGQISREIRAKKTRRK
jgi:hypothetical protein